jgi:hypothetical protein
MREHSIAKTTQDMILKMEYYNENQILSMNQMVKNIAIYITIENG